MTRHVQHWPRYVTTIVVAVVGILLIAQAREDKRYADRAIGVTIEEYYDLRVVALSDDSPAAMAGLAVGDVLLELNDRRLIDFSDYDLATRGLTRGKGVVIRIARDGATHELEILPGVPFNWWRLLRRLAVSLISLSVGAFSLIGRPADVRARLLAVLFFLIGVEFALPEALREDSAWRVVGDLSFYLLTGAQLAVELHLAAIIPRPRPERRWLRWFVAFCYVAGSAIAVGGSMSYLAEMNGQTLFPWTLYGFEELIHQVVLPMWAAGVVLLLVLAAVSTPERRGRLQSALVLLGVLPWTVYIGVGWALDFPDRLTTHGVWTVVMPLLVLCYPLCVFVAIFRYQLFDLEVVVRRGLTYTALTTTVVFVFYTALGAGGAILSRITAGRASSIWSVAAATLLLGLLFSPLRRAIQDVIDRSFFPERQMMRQRLIDLAGELPALGKLDLMGRHLVLTLRRIFRSRSAMLLLAEPGTGVLLRIAQSGYPTNGRERPWMLGLDDPGVARAHADGTPMETAALTASSPALEKRLAPLGDGVAVPLCLETRLVGILLLGEKTTGLRFSSEEHELLGLISHNVAAVLENVRLFESATYDRLTSLMRREAVLELLDRELERASRYGRPLTVGLADIDHFKGINDRFGHREGDRALRLVARELAALVRSSDGLGRYGGEEFLLVFPETDLADGVRMAEKLRLAVERIRLRAEDGSPIDLRISIGMASAMPSGDDDVNSTGELISAADRALYRAKRAGRNRVEPQGVDSWHGTPSYVKRAAPRSHAKT